MFTSNLQSHCFAVIFFTVWQRHENNSWETSRTTHNAQRTEQLHDCCNSYGTRALSIKHWTSNKSEIKMLIVWLNEFLCFDIHRRHILTFRGGGGAKRRKKRFFLIFAIKRIERIRTRGKKLAWKVNALHSFVPWTRLHEGKNHFASTLKTK